MSIVTEENRIAFPTIKGLVGRLFAVIIGMFIVYLDHTAMNVMLPRLIEDFHNSYISVQWTVTGYVLALAFSKILERHHLVGGAL